MRLRAARASAVVVLCFAGLLAGCGGSGHPGAGGSPSPRPTPAGLVRGGTATLRLNSTTHTLLSLVHLSVQANAPAIATHGGDVYTFPATGGSLTASGGSVDLGGALRVTALGHKVRITALAVSLPTGAAAAPSPSPTGTASGPAVTGDVGGFRLTLFSLDMTGVPLQASKGQVKVASVPVSLGGALLAQLGAHNLPSAPIGTLTLEVKTTS